MSPERTLQDLGHGEGFVLGDGLKPPRSSDTTCNTSLGLRFVFLELKPRLGSLQDILRVFPEHSLPVHHRAQFSHCGPRTL